MHISGTLELKESRYEVIVQYFFSQICYKLVLK